jgi:hypothetical protein
MAASLPVDYLFVSRKIPPTAALFERLTRRSGQPFEQTDICKCIRLLAGHGTLQ